MVCLCKKNALNLPAHPRGSREISHGHCEMSHDHGGHRMARREDWALTSGRFESPLLRVPSEDSFFRLRSSSMQSSRVKADAGWFLAPTRQPAHNQPPLSQSQRVRCPLPASLFRHERCSQSRRRTYTQKPSNKTKAPGSQRRLWSQPSEDRSL